MKKLIIRFHKKLTPKDYKTDYKIDYEMDYKIDNKIDYRIDNKIDYKIDYKEGTITHMSLRFPANLIPYANTIIPNKVGKMSVKM